MLDASRYPRRRYGPESKNSVIERPSVKPTGTSQTTASTSANTTSCKSQPSSFLSRLARTSLKEAGYKESGKVGWISSSSGDSSQSSNLKSRLRWVETAFKKIEGDGVQPAQTTEQTNPTQQTPQQVVKTGDPKSAVGAIRQRIQNLRSELDMIDKDLSALE